MDVSRIVAENVKRLREERGLTLDAAAERTGVSRSMLSQIEKGDVNPTIAVLWKIAGGLRVSFTSLMERQGERAAVTRAGEATPLIEDGGRYINYPAFPFEARRPFETYRIQIAPGGGLSAQPHLKGTEEYITLFAGEVEITAEGEVYRLGPGDSIRFWADVPHGYRNAGGETAEMSMLIYYGE